MRTARTRVFTIVYCDATWPSFHWWTSTPCIDSPNINAFIRSERRHHMVKRGGNDGLLGQPLSDRLDESLHSVLFSPEMGRASDFDDLKLASCGRIWLVGRHLP